MRNGFLFYEKEIVMQIIHSDNAPAALGPYSQAMRVGDLVYTSGQIGIDPSAGKITSDTVDMNDFAAFNEVYARHFTGKPARSCVAAKALPAGALCEIEVIAEA